MADWKPPQDAVEWTPPTDAEVITPQNSEAKKKYTRFFRRFYNALRAASAAFYQSWKQA